MDYAANELEKVADEVNEHIEDTPRDYTNRFFSLNTKLKTPNDLINAAAQRSQNERKELYRARRREMARIARVSDKEQRRILKGEHKEK